MITANTNPDTVNILGTAVSVVDLDSTVELLKQWLVQDFCGRYISVTGVHGIMEGLRVEHIRRIHNQADLCVPDGMPLTWLGHFKKHKQMNRVYGPDLMLKLLEVAAARGFSNYYYGGKPGVADDLKTCTEIRFPSLRVVGTHCPPFRPLTEEEENDIIGEINESAPDLLWIGLSTPKQELLMASWRGKVKAKVMIGVGAAFDFHTGRVHQAPHWIQRGGLEWLFRTCMEPRRLALRYIRNNPAFLWHTFLQLSGLRKYPLESSPNA